MEEKIFIPQSNLSFDIQRFADLIDGQYTLEVTGITVTCYFTGITGDSVEVDNNTVTIGGKTFTASNASEGAEIKFTGSENAVTRIDIKNVAVTVDNVIYTPTGSAGIVFGADGTTIDLTRNIKTKINGITYVASAANTSVNVTADTITLVSGTIAVGADAESLTGKNFVVNDGVTATFNLQNSDSVTINGIAYKAIENGGSIEVDDQEISLDGNFEIKLAQGQSLELGNTTFTAADSSVTFTYDENNISIISGNLDLNFANKKETLIVDGVTYKGKGELAITDSLVTLDSGDFTVGDGTQSLSGKNFSCNAERNVVITLAGGDSNVTVNGVTYAAGAEELELTVSGDSVNIYGEGATVSGTGNFVIENSNAAVTINDVTVQSTGQYAAISFGENNTVKSLSSINVGDANLNLAADATISNSTFNVSTDKSLTLGGVTYSGTGAVTVNSTNSVTLSGTSMNVTATDTESLKGKNISFTGEVKINGDTYSSSGTNSGSVSINSEGTPTVSNSSVEFDENTPKTLSISQNKNLTVDGVTYTAKNSSAQVEVKGTAVKITNGTVAVENTAATYTVDLEDGATAQIGGVNFQKTSDSNSDADIHIENGNITLNAGFNVGDGNTPLNLTVTLTTSDQSTFNLGGGNVTVIQNSGLSGDVTGDPITGVNFRGNGSASVSSNTVTLTATDGGNISVSGTNVSDYTFTLSNGTFTFGNATINATSGTVNNVSVTADSIQVGSATYSTESPVTLTADANGGVSMTTDGTYTKAAGSTFTIDGDTNTYTSTSDITYSVIGGTESILSASGTRAYETGENITKNYGTYDYDVTAGTYSVTVTSGTGTATLTGDAQKIFTAGQSFSYNSHSYEPIDGNVTYNISFNGDTINEGTKSGSGTRNDDGTGTYEHNGDNAGTYTLSSGAIMKLTFGETPEEEFYSGSATLTTNSYINGDKTYTTSGDNLTLTLTKPANGTDSISFTSGTGTRTGNETFTYPPGTGKTYTPSGKVTYTLTAGQSEKLYAATGTRNVTGTDKYPFNTRTYTLTEGTYQIDITGGSTTASETLKSGTGTTTVNQAFKIKDDSKEYTPLNGGSATLTLNYNGTNETESFTGNVSYYDSTAQNFNDTDSKTYTTSAGITYQLDGSADTTPEVYNATGTRAFGNGDTAPTFDYQGNNYTVTEGTYTYSVTNGNKTATPTLTTTTAVFTADTGSTFKVNDSTTYTALTNTTFTLNKDSGLTTSGGSGTRTVTNENKNYTSNEGNAYQLSASTYQIDLPNTTDYLIGGSATKTVSTFDSFKVNGQTYKPKDNPVTLKLSFSGGEHQNENETVSGNGTRRATEENSFTYGTKTYSSTNIVKITENGDAEELYSATGTRSNNANEAYTYNEHTYTLTSGTFNIDVTDNNNTTATEYLTSGAGTMTTNAAFTIKDDATIYTPLSNGNATLKLTVTGKEEANKSESFTGEVIYTGTEGTFTTGNKTYTKTSANITYKIDSNTDNTPEVYTATGTRAFGQGNNSNTPDSATDTYNGDIYTVTAGTYSYSISGGNNATETLKNSTATYSIGAGTRFHFGENSTEYTAIQDTKLTLGYNNGTANGLTNASGAGTRTATAADSGIKFTYQGDTYTTNAGAKIKGEIKSKDNISDTFLFGTATYTTSDGTFHTNNQTYTAIATTTITYNKANESATPTKTFSSGSAGTRTAAGTETDTYSGTNAGTYTIAANSYIKWTANANTNTGTETFYSGSATRQTNSYTHTNNKEYTSAGATDLTLTWTKTNDTDNGVTFTSGIGTRTDTSVFTYSGKTYTLINSGEATYTLKAKDANEQLLAATGTRSSDANDTTTGQWESVANANTYSFPNSAGTVKITVSNYRATGDNAPKVIAGDATETYTKDGTKKTFTYSDNSTYTANRDVTLKLVVSDDGNTKIETFESGSAQNDSQYIVKKGSQVDIGNVTYSVNTATAENNVVTIGGTASNITSLSTGDKITGTFDSDEVSTINGIAYTAKAATTLELNTVNNLKANGNFEATGNFETERILSGDTYNVTGDADIKTTFGASGITKIENLTNGANIKKAGSATTAITDANGNGTFIFSDKTYTINTTQNGAATFTLDSGKVTKIEAEKSNGTFTFGTQTFTIADDATEGVTFTIDTDGKATKLERLERAEDGAYVHVTVNDGTATPTANPIKIRRTGDDLEKTGDKWEEQDVVNFYVVTYDGTSGTNGFTVKAVDTENQNTLLNITTDDYTVTDKTLTFNTDELKKKVVIVENKTNDAIKVGNLDGDIKNTNDNVIRIDSNGDFKIGSFNGTTFTESLSDNFDVNDKAEFEVTKDGQINVSAKTDATTGEVASGMIEVEAPKNSNLHIKTKGTFNINGASILQIDSNDANDIKIKFDGNSNVAGIKTSGACQITVMPTYSSSFDLAESADTEKTIYNRNTFHVEDTSGNIIYVIVNNDDDGIITYTTDDSGKLSAISNISNGASVMLSGSIAALTADGSITINGDTISGAVEINTWINRNSTTGNWTSGDTADTAIAGVTDGVYRVEIGADNKVRLYVGDQQTKNVADYKFVFGAETTIKPENDDGDLPTYPASSGLTIDNGALASIYELKITPPTSASSYKIQDYDVIISAETTFKPTASTLEVTLKSGANVIYDTLTYTSTIGTSRAIFSSGGITIENNAKVSNVNDQTFTAKGTVTFDDVTVSDLNTTEGTAISGVTTNTNSTTMQIGNDAISVTGDRTYSIDATNKKITGISNGAEVTANGYTIETDSNGTFKFGDDAQFVVAGDDRVTFKDVGGAITEISDLSAAGSITGDFTAAINVNADDNAVEVAEDNDIGVIGGNGTVSKIYNVSGGAEVKQAGGAATISTDGNGTFTFGAKTYAISAGTADFLSSGVTPAISGIKNVSGSATVSVYQAESAFAVNGNSITFTGDDYSEPLQLAMGGDTISTVEGLESGGAITGLSAGAVVKGTGDNAYTVNNKAIQITDSDFNIHASASGYASVTGIANNAVFNNVEDSTALLIPNEAGTYTFGSDEYEFDAVPTLKADGAELKEVIGLTNGNSAILYNNESGLKVGNDTVILTRGDGASGGVKLTMNNGNVSTVENLEEKDAIKGLSTGTIVKVAQEIPVKINDSDLNVDKAATVYAASGGYSSVTGVDGSSSAATFTKIKDGAIIIPSAAGTYAFGSDANPKTYSFDGVPTLIAGADKLASIGGLTNGQSATIYQNETGLKVGNDTIILTRDEGTSGGVKLTMNNGNVSTVENLEEGDAIKGLTAGAIVKTTADIPVGINADSANFNASKAASVYVKSGGYDSVTGFDADTQFKNVANGTILIPTAEGEASYIFGDDDDAAKTYKFSAKPILKTGANSLASIGGLSSGQTIELYDIETSGLYIGSNKIKLEAVEEDGEAKVGADDDKVTFTMGDNNTVASVNNLQDAVSGLSTGAIVKVPEGDDAVKINNVELNVDKAATVYAASNGYSTVTGVDGSSAAVTFTKIKDGAVIIPSAAGTYAFVVDDENQKTYEFDAVPTLVTGADNALAAISGLASGQKVTLFKNETGLKVGKNNIDITRGEGTDGIGIVLTMGNDTISTVEGMVNGDAISNLTAGAVVKGTTGQSITVNTKAIQISSDSSESNFNIYASASGYSSVTGIASGVTFNNVADSTALLIPDAAGTFTFGDGGKYDFSAAPTLKAENTDEDAASLKEIIGLNADQSVTIYREESGLKVGKDTITLAPVEEGGTANVGDGNGVELIMNAAGNIATVKNLQDAISGLNSGTLVNVKEDEALAVKINGADLAVNKAVTAHVKDSTGYDYVTGLKDGAEVTKAANVSFVTDGTGTFKFPDSSGGEAHTFQIEGDTEVTINTGENSQVTEINGVASALIVVSQNESALSINGKSVNVNVSEGQATLKVDANGVVEGIDGMAAGGEYNLPANVTIAVDPTGEGVKINTKDLKITGQDTVTVHTATVGYDWISGIKTGAEVTAVESGVSIVTNGTGTFAVGTQTYNTDDVQITLNTGDSNKVTAIAGLDVNAKIELRQKESGLLIGRTQITFAGDEEVADGSYATLTMGDNDIISKVENLQYDISGLSADTFVQVTKNDGAVRINGVALQTTDDNVTVHATANGYDYVTGLKKEKTVTTAPSVSLVTAEEGTFIFGTEEDSHTFNTDDAQVTLKTDAESKLIEIAGLDADKYVDFSQAETNLTINGKKVTFTNVDDDEEKKLRLTIGNNGTIASVKNLQGDISGLSAGALVQVTATENAVKINGTDELKVSQDVTVRATAAAYDSVTGFTSGATFSKVKSGVILIPDAAGTFSFGNDESALAYEFSDKPTLVAGADKLASIGGLISGQTVKLDHAETSGLYIGSNKITLKAAEDDGEVKVGEDDAKVTFTMGDNNTVKTVDNLQDAVSGLSAGALVRVTATENAVKINGKALQTDDGDVTVHATAGGYGTITGLKADKAITAVESNAYIVTDGAGTYTFGKDNAVQTFITDDAQITLKTGEGGAIKEIAGLDTDKYLKLSQDETGLYVNGRAITVKGAVAEDEVKLVVDSNGLISKVENLKGEIHGLSANALVQVTKNDDAVQINGVALNTDDGDVTVHTTADGYDTITGLSNGKSVKAAKQNSTIVTDAEGDFIFVEDKTYTIADDNSVAFVMGDDNKLAGVYELNGKVSGDFTSKLKVDGRDVLIDVDDAVDIYADGSKVTKIEGLDADGDVNVHNSGGAETISTGNGTFTFGAKKYNISAGKADFLSSGDVPVISGIKNLGADDTDVEVTVFQNETALTVGDNTLKLGGVDTTNGLKLTMSGDTISTVDKLVDNGEVSGLSAGANVHVATNTQVTVNGLALQIDDSDFYVQTAANGYSAITGVAGNVTKAVNASIEIETNDNADTAEEFVFGSASNQKTYTINGDVHQKVTFVTDGNTSVTAVSGLNGSLKSSASSNKINGVNVYSSNPEVWFVATGDNGIASLNTVTDGNIISVPAGVEVAITDNNDATVTDFSINGIAYHLLCEPNTEEEANIIYVKDKVVKRLPTNARLTISGAEGNYVVNGKELYITPGRNVVIGEATGAHLYDPDAVDFSTFTPEEEIIERVFGENVASTIVPVENGSSDQSPGAVLVTQSGGYATLDKDQQLAVVKAEGTVNISHTNDSVVASADVNVNLQSGNSNARLMQTAGEMTVNGYDYSTGAGIQISNADVIAAVQSKAVQFGDTLTLDNGATMKITYADEKDNIVNLYDITGKKKQTVYYASADDQTINATTDSSANVFTGSWRKDDDVSLSNIAIYGGSGNDTAFGGAGDFFNLGNGDNYLELKNTNGATVELTATSGNTTVKGFGSSDIVKLNAANAQVYYTAAGLTFTNANGQASLSIQDVTAAEDDGATGISYANVLIKDRNASGDASPIKTAVAREGMAIKVQDDGATAYVGQNSGIDLTALNNGDINLDTGNGLFTFTNGGVTDVTFRGITSIKGGSGDHELTGSATISNTLEAGTGACEIWGKGAANDLLIAADYTAENGKKASTFIFEKGDGNDTISNIQFYDSSDEAVEAGKNDAMDVVSISGSASTSLSTSGNDVIIKYTDTGDTMTIKDAVGKKFKVGSVSGGTANFLSVGKDYVTFDGGAGFYYAAEPNSSLVVGSGVSENDTINLNGDGNYTIDKNITIIDASAATNAIMLVGNDNAANTIKAGTGGSTIYAGMRDYDDLIDASASDNVADLFQCKNAGNDTIIGAGTNDTIEFTGRRYSRSMSILEYEAGKKLVLGLSNTSKLTIDESNIESLTFKFSNQEWGWNTFKLKVTNKTNSDFSADLAEDYWENDVCSNELLDGDADLVQRDSAAITFDNAENISYVDSNLLTGDIQFSVASGEQVYNFSALVDKRNK